MAHASRWSIFCRVVDHYGDAGVCWRLARQLAHEHGIAVTLYIDDPATLARLLPSLDPSPAEQWIDGLCVCRLAADIAPPKPWPDVIIDAFGGGLPASWLTALTLAFPPGAPGTGAPHWIVLEYLSAESWVETMHARASPPPTLNMPRHFFFPGFTAATGGLLREVNLFAERDAFQSAPENRRAFLARFGIEAPPPEALVISLFCYDTPALPALLDAWAANPQPIVCLLPESVAPAALAAWRRRHHVNDNANNGVASGIYGALTLRTLPFLPQTQFDRLLWACDLNFVRGEDSFVRAQWAARPFIWQAYRQTGQAHLPKIDAFLARYLATSPAPPESVKAALIRFTRAWNDTGYADDIAAAWQQLSAQRSELVSAAEHRADTQSALPDLARQLADFTIHFSEKSRSGL